MRKIALFLLCCVPVSYAAEVYRWVDSHGVAHYSQLPPSGDTDTNLSRINTAYTPGQQALIEKAEREEAMRKLMADGIVPPAAAGGDDTCSALEQDKFAYEKRRIESVYLNARNACDVTYHNSEQKAARLDCYQDAEQVMQSAMTNVAKVRFCR
ncbi:DUF4124 domain-containing protein [Pseudaeromonas sharmana]|uniref:DUF4124 domain-containing protein n=1 Tax=Pseudaeromonas sharmana TaxID=328412 RepID=A0ABV8CPU9_9GAMM